LFGRIAMLRLKASIIAKGEEIKAPDLINWSHDPITIARHADATASCCIHTLHVKGTLLRGLQALGLHMHEQTNGGWAELALNDSQEPAMRAASAMNLATHHTNGNWQFTHQLWQEYFAAWALSQGDRWRALDLQPPLLQDVPPETWELPQPDPSPWDQCLQMAVAMAPAATALAMFEHLLGVNLALAARALLARGEVREDGSQLHDIRQSIKQSLLARSTDAGTGAQPSADVRLRIEAGLLLGELGDDIRYVKSLGSTNKPYIVPADDRLIAIPSGTFTVGGLLDYQDSANTVSVTIKTGIRMAFAPVTNAEYRCFVVRPAIPRQPA
jgi:hypothetical protein